MSMLDTTDFSLDPVRGKLSQPNVPKPVASPVPVAPVPASGFLEHLRRVYGAAGLQNPNQRVGPPAPTRADMIRSAAGAEAAPVQAPGRIGLRDRLNAIQNERFRTLQSLSPNMTPEQRLMLIQHRQGLDQEQKFAQGIQRADEVRPQLDQGPPTPEIAEAIDTGTTAKQQYMTQLQDMANRKERARQLEKLGIYGDPNMAADQADEMDTRKAATAAQLRLLNAKAQGAEYDANPELRMLRESMDLGQKEAAFNQQIKRGDQELALGDLKLDQARYESDPAYRKAIMETKLIEAKTARSKAEAENAVAGAESGLTAAGATQTALLNNPVIRRPVDLIKSYIVTLGSGNKAVGQGDVLKVAAFGKQVQQLKNVLSALPPAQQAQLKADLLDELQAAGLQQSDSNSLVKQGFTGDWTDLSPLGMQPSAIRERIARGQAQKQAFNDLIALLSQ